MSNASNKMIYIGVTNDLIKRVYEHKSKTNDGFTKRFDINKLVYYEEFNDVNDAISREKQLKKWRREKKNWLIQQKNPSWNDWSEGLVL